MIKMTEKQRIAVNNLYRALEKKNKNQVLKEWEIDVRDYGYKKPSPVVFLRVEFGYEGDEGKLSSLYCRDYRFIIIGPQGGCKLGNALRSKDEDGFFNAVWGLTERIWNRRKRRGRRAA